MTLAGTAVKTGAQAVTSSAVNARLHYDMYQAPVFNFFYDILQLSSGRDKVVAFIQNFAKYSSDALCVEDSERYWICRGVEENLSDSRKVFRFLKWLREVYKVRRGLNRADQGLKQSGAMSIDFTCGVMDVLGHTCSFFYFLLDNLLWATSVGVLRSKGVPEAIQRLPWYNSNVPRRNGWVVASLGGVTNIKRLKNRSSLYRLFFALTANILLLHKAWRSRALARRDRLAGAPVDAANEQQGSSLDNPLLFHSLEVLGMLCNGRVLLSKLGFSGWGATHAYMGALGMFAASQGVWRNWRKVVQKKCGSKFFTRSVLHDSPALGPAAAPATGALLAAPLSLSEDENAASGASKLNSWRSKSD